MDDSKPSTRRPVVPPSGGVGRRGLVSGLATLGLAAGATPAMAQGRRRSTTVRSHPPQFQWSPPPAMTGTERMVALPDVKLWCVDTGGAGQPVVFLHPATGSGAIWGYQQAAFVAAGYRVITYSRRGHYRSESGPEDRRGTIAGDLHDLVNALGLERFHLVGSALGGFGPLDYVLSYPDRVRSMVVACSLAGVVEPEHEATTRAIIPPGFNALPAEFREVGPSYRAANPEGVAAWKALEDKAVPGPPVRQGAINKLDWAALGSIRTPTLLLTGDSDLYMPPSRLRILARRMPEADAVVIEEAGHSAYWEQPIAFNKEVLALLRRAGRR